MGQNLRVSTYQMDIVWEDLKTNWNTIVSATLNLETDILVLPEMFLSGFSTDPQLVAVSEGDGVLEKIKSLSKRLKAAICGSLAVLDSDKFVNRMYFVQPNGTVDFYDKKHLFRMAGEDKKYAAGASNTTVEYRGFKWSLQICYDLRFPVWSRNSNDIDSMYDCLIYVANWPKVRSDAWYSLLKARAIENWCYCVGVNRVGLDGNGLEYDGKSAVFDFKGNELTNHTDHQSSIETTLIYKDKLNQYRSDFPAYLDAD